MSAIVDQGHSSSGNRNGTENCPTQAEPGTGKLECPPNPCIPYRIPEGDPCRTPEINSYSPEYPVRHALHALWVGLAVVLGLLLQLRAGRGGLHDCTQQVPVWAPAFYRTSHWYAWSGGDSQASRSSVLPDTILINEIKVFSRSALSNITSHQTMRAECHFATVAPAKMGAFSLVFAGKPVAHSSTTS